MQKDRNIEKKGRKEQNRTVNKENTIRNIKRRTNQKFSKGNIMAGKKTDVLSMTVIVVGYEIGDPSSNLR